jgi:hypothetical protein
MALFGPLTKFPNIRHLSLGETLCVVFIQALCFVPISSGGKIRFIREPGAALIC